MAGKLAPVSSEPVVRKTSTVVANNARCRPLFDMYNRAKEAKSASWNQVEADFLSAMGSFDASISSTAGRQDMTDSEKSDLSADLQNGKGDFFNDLLALLLENCSGIPTLYCRNTVPGLIVRNHNLDGVYPGTGPIEFLLEAKMMGTPRHVNSPRQKAAGRPGSADIDKRVKELAFKSIDLKGEHSRRRTAEGIATKGGPAGGDLTTWLKATAPGIYFFLAVRITSRADLARTLEWASVAGQVVNAVGLYCFEADPADPLKYRRTPGIPTNLELERVLYRACTDLRAIAEGSQ